MFKGYWPVVFLSYSVFVWFWYQGDAHFIEYELRSIPPLTFWRVWKGLVLLLVVASLAVEHRLYVCRLQKWEHTGWVVKVKGSKACAQKLLCIGLIVPCHVGSFWTRDWTCVLCIDRQILNYVTTREVPKFCFLIFLYFSFLHFILCSNLYCIFLSATFVFSSSFSCSLNCKFVILRCLLICFCVSQLVGF